MDNTAKIIGLGLSKTGTSSLSDALSMLKIPTIHYPYDEVTLAQLKAADYQLTLFNKYRAVVDIPLIPFFPQFDHLYPGTKFILTLRDINDWLVSIEKHWELMMVWQENTPAFKTFHEFVSIAVFGCLKFQKERFKYIYEKHTAHVLDYFKDRQNDLLVMDICKGDGWAKLCPFLNLAEPEISFPHANEWMHKLLLATEEFKKHVPESKSFILIDQESMGGAFATGRSKVYFTEYNEMYNGMPATDQLAVKEFNRSIARVDYLVIAWPCYWIFEHYPIFIEEINKKCTCILKNERLTIYLLHK